MRYQNVSYAEIVDFRFLWNNSLCCWIFSSRCTQQDEQIVHNNAFIPSLFLWVRFVQYHFLSIISVRRVFLQNNNVLNLNSLLIIIWSVHLRNTLCERVAQPVANTVKTQFLTSQTQNVSETKGFFYCIHDFVQSNDKDLPILNASKFSLCEQQVKNKQDWMMVVFIHGIMDTAGHVTKDMMVQAPCCVCLHRWSW